MPGANGVGIHRQFARAARLSVRFRQRIASLPIRAACRKEGVPLPPGRLIHLVAGTEDTRWFLESGRIAANWIEETLRRQGYALADFPAFLDFGCGVGRVLRHFSALKGPTIFGTDYNPSLVAWCRNHLSFVDCELNALDRPLTHPDASLDFVYALSVFTHLSEESHRFWMHEIARILKPGGLILLTTHGRCYRDHLTDSERTLFDEGRLVVKKAGRQGSNDCAAFHPESYVRESLAASFEVIDYQPEGAIANPSQDYYLLRKRA